MYAFESHPRRKGFHLLVGGCFVVALVLLAISGLEGISYPVIYQGTAFLLVTAGAYLMVRYVLNVYRYEISESGIISADGEAQYDLVITEITGKRRRVVTRVALRDIDAVAVIPRKKKDAQKAFARGKERVFRYTNDPFDAVSCYLSLPTEDSVVVIPLDDTMILHLRRFCTVTKEGEET